MNRFAVMLGVSILAFPAMASAQDMQTAPPCCEPGFRYVQEISYQEVEHACCKEVPNIRKKWVYCSKPDYFCVPSCKGGKCGKRGGCENCGGDCDGYGGDKCNLYCRQQLMKKQVECVYGTKCVVEITKEKVPCVVWRKVPCGPEQLPTPPMAAPGAALPSAPALPAADAIPKAPGTATATVVGLPR